MGREDYLFAEGDLDATMRAHQATISAKIDAIPRDQFMNAQPEEVVAHIMSAMTVEPLVIYEDRAEMDQQEMKIDVSEWRDRNPFGRRGPIYVAGVAVSVSVPFTGDATLWKLKPNHWQSVFPRAKIVSSRGENAGHVQIDMAQPTDEAPERFKERLDAELDTIRFYLHAQQQQIERFNAGLYAQVLGAVGARRDRIRKHEGLQGIMGIPMKRKEGVPAFAPVKIARKVVRPLPPPPKSGYKPEPGILEEDYLHILSVIRHEGRTLALYIRHPPC